MRVAVESEAARLAQAAETGRAVPPLTERVPDLTVEDAYAIQQAGIAQRIGAGARVVGRKVGLTSRAMQEMLGVSSPDYGVLLDEMIAAASEGIDSADLIAPRIEAEIAFDLAEALEGPDVDVDRVLSATKSVRAALEVIDSRIEDWRIAFEDTIADNASSALVILGDPAPVEAVDLLGESATLTVADRSATGAGSAVLGHPAEAVAWLARTLADRSEGLRAGDVLLPGAMAAALPIASGDLVKARWTSLGELEVAVR